jgi:hypothetical protein
MMPTSLKKKLGKEQERIKKKEYHKKDKPKKDQARKSRETIWRTLRA